MFPGQLWHRRVGIRSGRTRASWDVANANWCGSEATIHAAATVVAGRSTAELCGWRQAPGHWACVSGPDNVAFESREFCGGYRGAAAIRALGELEEDFSMTVGTPARLKVIVVAVFAYHARLFLSAHHAPYPRRTAEASDDSHKRILRLDACAIGVEPGSDDHVMTN
jgi:hypothetical protein